MTPATEPTQTDLFDAEIIPLRLAIKAMRDSGYKNTAYALAELIDNAAQANATMIEVLCVERRELVRERERSRLHEIAVLDNGTGMDARTLRMALQFGNGTRLDDRSGIGRFGMGLPNAIRFPRPRASTFGPGRMDPPMQYGPLSTSTRLTSAS